MRQKAPVADKIAILFNPGARRGKSSQKITRLEKELHKHGVPFEFLVSLDESDLRRMVPSASRRFSRLAAAGGDSTYTMVAHELLRLGLHRPLGMIPLGSCNDICRELDIATLRRSCQAIRENRQRPMDAVAVSSEGEFLQYYLGQTSLGLGVLVNQHVEAQKQRQSPLCHWQTAAGALATWQTLHSDDLPLQLTIRDEKGSLRGAFSLAVFSNTRYYASGRLALPAARCDDGRLDGLFLRHGSFHSLFTINLQAARGRHTHRREVSLRQSRFFEVHAERPFAVQIDGELLRTAGSPAFSKICAWKSFPRP